MVGVADAMGSSGASSDDGTVGPLDLQVNRDHARRHVGNTFGYQEGADALHAFGHQDGVLFFDNHHAADSGPNDGADPLPVRIGDLDSGVFDSFPGRHHGKLGKALDLLGFLGREMNRGIVVVDGRADFAGDLIGGQVGQCFGATLALA